MAIKLADTLAPMADFPAVEAKDVAFNDNKTLQEKYDKGELGGGGISITVDSAMSDTSINPVQNKVIKAYVDSKSVDISADSDNAIQNKTDGIYVEKTKISIDDGNALSKKSNGLFVQDLSNKVSALNIAQKTVNEDLEYFSATGTEINIFLPESLNYNFLPYLDTIKTNLDSSRYTTQYITLKAGKTYQLSFGTLRSADKASGSSYHIVDSLGNKIGNRGHTGGQYGDNIVDVIYTPTSDIKINPMIVTNATSKYFPDCSFFTVKEVSRTITIDPVEYVDSTKGIEDTPVGEIIRTIGNKTPKHYLMCDGSTHNIADYPYLAQYFKDTFGAINVFGGDGTTTFGVPDYTIEKRLNTQYMAPNAWASSMYSSDYAASKAFNGTLNITSNYWQALTGVTLPVEIGIDLGNEYYITRYALHNLGWNTGAINDRPNTWDFEGSNNKTNWNTIDTVTNYIWTSNTPEFKVSMPGSYRYYRLIIKTCVGTGVSGVIVTPILNQILLYYSNSNFTHIKAEPTYYMELNQAAYINQYCDVYSTDEKIVGKWVDGKPLYRKGYTNITITASGGSQQVIDPNITVANGYLVNKFYGSFIDSSKVIINPLPCTSAASGSATNVALGVNNTGLILVNSYSSFVGRTATVFIEYTKSTDAENSFDYGMIIDQFAQEALLDVAVTDAEVDKCFE